MAQARGQVWLVVTNPSEALELQARFPTSGFVAQNGATAVRVLSHELPHMRTLEVEPTLEDAYLLLVRG